MSNTSIDSWDGLLTNFLKAEHLQADKEDFVCVGVEVVERDMNLELMGQKDKKFIFALNVTNKVFLKNNKINSPKEVIGKKLTLRKVKAYNPTLKKEVDGLRIEKIE